MNSSVESLRLDFFEKLVRESQCLKKCKSENLEPHMHDSRVMPSVDEDFDHLKPYSYLQFCYYKLERYTDAACAAYTFFLKNSDDEDTIGNIRQYRESFKVKDEDFRNMEKALYQDYRIKGESAYDENDWTNVIEWTELAIAEYYNEEERCQLECEGHFDHLSFPDFIQAIADHYISALQCQFRCEKKLSILYKEYLPDYVGQHYNYLQYAYYKNGNTDKAVEAAATYLLFNPNDAEMLRNKAYYIQKLGYHQAHFVPRQEAVSYVNRREKMLDLLYFIRDKYDIKDKEDLEDENKEEDLIEEELEKIQMINPDNIKSSKSNSVLLNKEHYMGVYNKIGIKIKMDKNDRFVADEFYREDQCRELVSFVNANEANSDGIRVLTVSDGLQIIKENLEFEISLRLFLRASELTRHFSAHFYNESSYFIKKAVIVCVDPKPDQEVTEDCIPQEDGSCLTEDDMDKNELQQNNEYIVVSFLTEEEEPGHFSFLDRRHRKQLNVSSKCGRVVGFKSSERYRSDRSDSQRCSMILTFTTNRTEDNPLHRKASSYLLSLEKGRSNPREIDNKVIMKKFQNDGVEIVMAEKELKSKERFVADGLMTEEQCQTLMDITQEGALSGDGYKLKPEFPHSKHETFEGLTVSRSTEKKSVEGSGGGKEGNISPHTERELFAGLSVWRSLELAHVGVISKKAANLYLDVSEYGRLLVEKYFNLTQPLYFDFTHLVCRTAVEGLQDDRIDLSHPVHADNCLLQADGACHRQFPAYVQRDYSAVIYLNDDFDGGDFFFAHRNRSAEVSLRPKCGRIVGFNAAELHGVKAVVKGQRCALAMWYTMDLSHKELARIQAKKILDKISDKTEENVHEEL